ncbi:C40 family peptidase [Oribacterium sinus]|uniref:C40 family peptidase n=1 Tax=Oribacterium sinus TaxID=237576 RepID=A0A930GVK6_9FIRM|nr:NlpC/P60 family protein [Oribacterium sinus]MBF1272294.1 C40 family peptidase [Oribacterium sinus]
MSKSRKKKGKWKPAIEKAKIFLKSMKKESFLLFFLSLFMILCLSIVYAQKMHDRQNALNKSSDSLLRDDITSSSVMQKGKWTNTIHTERKEDEFINPRPFIDRYNLVDIRQDGNPLDSVGGRIYQELMERESADLAKIYDSTGDTPEHTAKLLGLKRSAILGRYNPQAAGQSPEQKNSWAIPYFKNIHYRYYNGDGKEIQESSNVKDILAMASVYTYQHNYLDEERFRAIVNELYTKSHSYSLSIGPVYYDQGCIHKDAKEEMLAEEAANTVAPLGGETKASEESKAESASEKSSETTADSKANQENSQKSSAGEGGESSSESKSMTEQSEKSSENKENSASQNAELSSSNLAKETTGTKTEQKANSIQEQKKLPKNYCPGHVDLTIKITVIGFDDENGLRNIQLDSIKDLEEQDQKPGSRWHGWDDYTIAAVKRLKEQDWFKDYGLSISSVEKKSPLTEEEISSYMKDLPKDLSEERKALIHFALSSVGKVPYFYGGKAGVKGLEGNHFGATISSSDYKGRNRKGLDCSGFVQWAYWSSVDRSLDFASSTQELIGKGQKIKRSELKAGDLIIQPSGESHVVVFIKWTKEGKMLAVHENGTAGNISVDEVQANYPYYRSILP